MSFTFDDITAPIPAFAVAQLNQLRARIDKLREQRAMLRPDQGIRKQQYDDRLARMEKQHAQLILRLNRRKS